MGSIPLVALGVKPPQIDNYQDMQARAAGIQNMRGQNALQPGQLQEQKNQLEMQKRQLADQDAMNKAMGEWDPKDIEALPALVQKHGGSAQAVMGLKTGLLKMQSDTAALTETQQKIEKIKNDHFAESLGNVLELPPEQQAQGFQAAVADSVKQGFMDPQHAQQLQYQNPMQLASLRKVLLGHAAVMDEVANQVKVAKDAREEEKAKQDAATTAAKLPGEVADSAIKQEELKQMQTGGINSKIPLEKQEATAWLNKHPGKDLADYQRYKSTLVPAFNFNLQSQGVSSGPTLAPGTTPEDAYKSFGNKGPTIKAIVEGRQTPPTSFAQKSPYWQDVMNKVYQVDPEFTEQRAQLRKAYTVGPQSKEINAINTAMGHVGVLSSAIDALNNGDIKALNSLANTLGVQTGNDKVTTFNTIVHRVGPEISKAYIGAGGSAGERGTDEKDFDPSLGPQQLKSNVAITAKLLRSKISSFENQWNQNKSTNEPSFQDKFIMPEAKAGLDRLAPEHGGGGSFSVKAPNGKTYSFKDQKSLDSFKAKAGIQ